MDGQTDAQTGKNVMPLATIQNKTQHNKVIISVLTILRKTLETQHNLIWGEQQT